jgi:hypothetical protein
MTRLDIAPARGASHFYAASFGTSANDIPALLGLAARALSSCVPNMPNVANPLASDALDPLAALYYAARNHHPMTQPVSDVDRRDVASRVASALVASCDRLASRTAPRDIAGRYGTRDVHAHICNGLAATVNGMRATLNAAKP